MNGDINMRLASKALMSMIRMECPIVIEALGMQPSGVWADNFFGEVEIWAEPYL